MLSIVRDGLYEPRRNWAMADILARFVVYVPSVVAPARSAVDGYDAGGVRLSVAHPSPSAYRRPMRLIEEIGGARAFDSNDSRAKVRDLLIK